MPGDPKEQEQMTKAKRTALVTGASGLAGGYMLAHLLEQGGWDFVAVSRRKPRIAGDYRHIAIDLLDPADCRTKLGPLTNISHDLAQQAARHFHPQRDICIIGAGSSGVTVAKALR